MTSSPAFLAAVAQWRAARAEFELVREAAYLAAENATRGVLLNALGRQRGIDPWSLFIGPEASARLYASEELLDWWDNGHPRLTFAAFERTWHDGPYGHRW